MSWQAWIVLVLALIEAGWFAFDGAHGLITGDYVAPKTGAHAGQLGPWSRLVEAVGLEPRSQLVMGIHLTLGVVWLAVMLAFALGANWAWTGMVVCAVLGIWYLPFGTLLSVLQLILLFLPGVRTPPG